VAINVVSSFVSYSTGVYFDSDCTKKNKNYVGSHAIVAIGYGTDAALGDYWLMRNSWGDKWGEQGNIRMARNKGNLCDLAKFAIYPRV
jgi:C1A family cysteine protease